MRQNPQPGSAPQDSSGDPAAAGEAGHCIGSSPFPQPLNRNGERTAGAPLSHRQLNLDHEFVALVDGRFADAARRSGPHILCAPGCSQCCVGVFAIGPADALRAQRGMAELAVLEPERAAQISARARASWRRLSKAFPGDSATGRLSLDSEGELPEAFEAFADQEPCPALDPEHGTCDLYAARPLTCRVFGPPVPVEGGYGVCELCFTTALPAEIAAAALDPVSIADEAAVDQAAMEAGAPDGSSILAFVLAHGGA